jgi:hypothetical protein
MANVFPLLGRDNHGGYGVVHKMRIERFNHIPSTIELAGNTPKNMINGKHVSNVQWKLWSTHVNI